MNVLLRDTQEFIDGKNTGSLGLVLIRYFAALFFISSALCMLTGLRCNNVLWMASADGVDMIDLGLK